MSQSPAMPHDCEPGLGPGAPRLTSRSGAGTGSGRSRSWSKREKMAALAPMPSARETTATAVRNGVLIRARSASFTLDMGLPVLSAGGGLEVGFPDYRKRCVEVWRGVTGAIAGPDQ